MGEEGEKSEESEEMKILFITFLLFFSFSKFVLGNPSWTIQYDMKQPDGSVNVVKVSVPSTIDGNWEIPYLVGRWECFITRYDHENSGSVSLQCSLIDDLSVKVLFSIDCDNDFVRDTKQNYMRVSLSGTKDISSTIMFVECEI